MRHEVMCHGERQSDMQICQAKECYEIYLGHFDEDTAIIIS